MRVNRSLFSCCVLCLSAVIILAGCDGPWSGRSNPSNSGNTISGQVVAGPVSGAIVTAYILNSDGSLGSAIGSGTTNAEGGFNIILTGSAPGAVAIVASGGSYIAESDGALVAKSSDLSAIVPAIGSGVTGLIITPLSDMLVASVRAKLAGGASSLAAALADAELLVKTTYGLTTPSIEFLKPLFDKASLGTSGYTLGLVLGSFDTCDKLLPVGLRGSLYSALSADFSDGVFDGKKFGVPVTISAGSFLSSTAGTSDFLTCISSYASTGKAVVDAGISPADIGPTVAAVRVALTGSPATPTSTGLSAGSSGAISSLAYGGKQWLFLAARAQGVVAIDITDPSADSPTVKNFTSLVATNFGGLPIGGVVPLIGADHPQLLVYAYGSKHIALVDADTGAVDYETNLPLTATSPVSFSGGSAYIAGAIPDTGRDGVWLATADGYLFFDRATKTVGTSFSFTSPAKLAENLGGDISHGMLFAANYAPGVQIADLGGGKSYYMDGSSFLTAFPQLFEPDGGAVDTNYQVGIITNEDSPNIGLLNLKTIVKTDAGAGRNTFVPSAGGSIGINLGISPTISGSAVDSDTHLALFMAGFSRDIAVGRLQDPATTTSWTGLTDWRFVQNLTGYAYATDPHAVAVVKNLTDGNAYGYLLDGGVHKAFQIDMAAFLAAPAGTNPHQLSTDPTTNGIVKSITW